MIFKYCPDCGNQTVIEESKTKYVCGNCDWVFWNNPKASIAVVIQKDGEILFSRRGIDPFKGEFDLPGGFVEFGEDVYAAGAREILEETGLTVDKKSFKILNTYTMDDYAPGVSTLDVILLARSWSGEPEAADDVADLIWKPISFVEDPAFCRPYPELVKIIEEHTQS
jgi:ADP-ribose pyrophosphatase YjhB (NUDIX family)